MISAAKIKKNVVKQYGDECGMRMSADQKPRTTKRKTNGKKERKKISINKNKFGKSPKIKLSRMLETINHR